MEIVIIPIVWFDEVITHGRANYDFVVVDTAPVNVVTDTLLLGHHADLFVYVVRANFLDKRLLKIPKMMHENKGLPYMAILINDTNYEKRLWIRLWRIEDQKIMVERIMACLMNKFLTLYY